MIISNDPDARPIGQRTAETRQERAVRLWDERRARRAARFAGYADSAASRARDLRAKSDATFDRIPFGQPMLVDHYSYSADRNRRERASDQRRRSWEEAEKSATWAARAERVESGAGGIRRNDPTAIEQLDEKIAGLEAELNRRKELNTQLRKAPADVYMTAAEARDFVNWLQAFYRNGGFKTLPTTGLSSNLRRYRDRRADLERRRDTAEASGGYARTLPNRWPGECVECGTHVEAGAGVAAQPPTGPWEIRCDVHKP